MAQDETASARAWPEGDGHGARSRAATRPTTDWDLRLGFLIHDVSRLRRNAFDRCLKPLKVTRSQWWMLAHLARADGMTQTQLSEEMDISTGAVARQVDRLQRAGFIRREADGDDHRFKRIFLQPRSRQLIAHMRALGRGLNGTLLAGLPEASLEHTVATLEAIKRNLHTCLAEVEARADAGNGESPKVR